MNWKAYITYIQGELGNIISDSSAEQDAFEAGVAQMQILCGITPEAAKLFMDKVDALIMNDPRYEDAQKRQDFTLTMDMLRAAVQSVRTIFESWQLL